MRDIFIDTITDLARKDDRIFLLTGDLGFSVFEGFQKEFPKRFINAGVAEQNMIGVAAGLALSGKIVFVYSIIPFVTMRCFEQIRNDICMHSLNVKIIGMGAGLHYGALGSTHHGIEDIGLMRGLPGMIVISPSTTVQVRGALKEAVRCTGPVYIRLSKRMSEFNERKRIFKIGKSILVRDGKDATIISTGSIFVRAYEVMRVLEGQGVSVRLVSMPTIKPLDTLCIRESAKKTRAVFVIDEHLPIGGLASAVAEVLAESRYKGKFKKFCLPDDFISKVGTRDYLLDALGFSCNHLVREIKKVIAGS